MSILVLRQPRKSKVYPGELVEQEEVEKGHRWMRNKRKPLNKWKTQISPLQNSRSVNALAFWRVRQSVQALGSRRFSRGRPSDWPRAGPLTLTLTLTPSDFEEAAVSNALCALTVTKRRVLVRGGQWVCIPVEKTYTEARKVEKKKMNTKSI